MRTNCYARKIERERKREEAKIKKRNALLCRTMNDRIMNDLRHGIIIEKDITRYKMDGGKSACTGCYFFSICPRLPKIACIGRMRRDRKSIIYVENKKNKI